MGKWWEWVFSGAGVALVAWLATLVHTALFKERLRLSIQHVTLFPNGNPNKGNELWQLSYEAVIANLGPAETILRSVRVTVRKDGKRIRRWEITSGAKAVTSPTGQVLPFRLAGGSTTVVQGGDSIGMRPVDMATLSASASPWMIRFAFDFGSWRKKVVKVSTSQPSWP